MCIRDSLSVAFRKAFRRAGPLPDACTFVILDLAGRGELEFDRLTGARAHTSVGHALHRSVTGNCLGRLAGEPPWAFLGGLAGSPAETALVPVVYAQILGTSGLLQSELTAQGLQRLENLETHTETGYGPELPTSLHVQP